jgi:hypothetical protein
MNIIESKIESYEELSETAWCEIAHIFICEDCNSEMFTDEYGLFCPRCCNV